MHMVVLIYKHCGALVVLTTYDEQAIHHPPVKYMQAAEFYMNIY